MPRLHSKKSKKIFLGKLDNSKMIILFGTGHHYDDNYTWRRNTLCGWGNISNILQCRDFADCMILGGDNVDSEHLEKSINVFNLSHLVNTFLAESNTDRFILRGNHDAGTLQQLESPGKVELNKIIGKEDFKRIFRTKDLKFKEVRDDDSLYLFKDYPEKKVRIICVDTIDYPEIVNHDGGLKYFDQGTLVFKNAIKMDC